ncbi:hypothetical protein [Larsenimonas suaedae]|uniref:Pectate lyase superfamily protein domain-containing protein n=1 Tax=Larsenimonas suaedae TaxID=1851019 RepID=A0ABU1GXR0_9GAMM|nr:hypothetical protein [Larsenimonas suaedae]MCM2971579.1 hypothetical protein [Larsenimonas suaedae]MDR5896835.1 hypothetical protein [Larsenimonas suaedae]
MTELTTANAVITVENVEKLRAYEPEAEKQIVQVLYHTYPYCGGGRFVASGDTKSADDNGMIIVTKGGCRWKRVTEGEERGNILLWGADPSGKNDSSSAIKAAIADGKTRTVVIPHEGKFVINETIELGRVSLIGGSKDHFGQKAAYSSLITGSDLDGAMFTKVGKNVIGIAFHDRNQTHTALEMTSYVNLVQNCSFHNFKSAIETPGGVDLSLLDNTFTSVETAIHLQDASLCTTSRFIRNHFHYVHDCILVDGELYGASFVDNIFERVTGRAIHGKVIYHSHFQGNWWEHRNGAEEARCVTTEMYQQLFYNTASANYAVFGWINVFNSDTHDNRVGGVMTGEGNVVIRTPTGQALRIDHESIKSECDQWTGKGDLTLETGYDKVYSNVGDFYIMAGNNTGYRHRDLKNGSLVFTSRGNDGSWQGKLHFLQGKDDDGNDLKESYSFPSWSIGGLVGEADFQCDSKVRKTTVAIPQQVLWDSGPSTGTGCFTEIDDSQPGRVRFLLEDGAPQLRNYLIHCTVHTRGVMCDGIGHVNVYGGSWNAYRRAKGFDVFFIDRETGEAKTPDRFCLMLAHVEGNKLEE